MEEPSSDVRESTTRESGCRQNGQCTANPFEQTRRRGTALAVDVQATLGHRVLRMQGDACGRAGGDACGRPGGDACVRAGEDACGRARAMVWGQFGGGRPWRPPPTRTPPSSWRCRLAAATPGAAVAT